MKKNICIIHFNTPILTRCLVRSINKYTPGTNIYIFDNSDKEPFVNFFDNVTVFDNTHGQFVDFDKELEKYPLRVKSRGKTNNYGSAKHAMSIQKCIELIGEDFVLLDSDVLLKRDISPVWNENYVWVAGVEDWQNKTLVGAKKRKRICPFLLYMNVRKMTELGITFYDDTHMLGLNNGPKCEEYETGVWMYETTPKNKRKVINYSDYIVHFRAGSWLEDARTKQHYKQISPFKWLERHKDKWLKPGETLSPDWKEVHVREEVKFIEKKKCSELFQKEFDHIYCLHYLPATDRLPKLKEELKQVGIDETASYFSWVYDYPSSLLDLLYKDKKLNMDTALKSTSRDYIKRVSLKHYQIAKEAYALGYKRVLIMENDIRFHKDLEYINKMLSNLPDADVIMFDKMTCSGPRESLKYKGYIKTLPQDALYGDMNQSGVFFIFCSCYSLNRKAMKRIIELHEDKLLPPDTPLNDKEITGSFAIINVAIQDPALKTRKAETYDIIGLDVSMYEKDEKSVPLKPVAKQIPSRLSPITSSKRVTSPEKIKKVTPSSSTKKKEPIRPQTLGQVRRLETRRPIVQDKAVRNRARLLHGAPVSHNKLYDVY